MAKIERKLTLERGNYQHSEHSEVDDPPVHAPSSRRNPGPAYSSKDSYASDASSDQAPPVKASQRNDEMARREEEMARREAEMAKKEEDMKREEQMAKREAEMAKREEELRKRE